MRSFRLLLTLLAVSTATDAAYVVRDGKFSVVSSSDTTSSSLEFATASSGEGRTPLPVKSLDTLKMSFTLASGTEGVVVSEDDAGGTVGQPTQLVVLARGVDTDRSWTGPIKLRLGGKARWDLDTARAPAAFLNLSPTGSISLEILVAELDGAHPPARIPVATLALDDSVIQPFPYWGTADGKPPAELEWEKYAPQPELGWTFRAGEKPVGSTISLIFTAIALSPWLFLLGSWSYLQRSGESSGFSLTSSPSPITLVFILFLLAEDLLIFVYWTSLRIYHYIPAALALAIPLVLTGRSALGQLRERRLESPIGRSAAASKGKGKGKVE